ncbi:putative ATP-dependent RNA helicase DHX35 [Gracilariopsis chorda]|uniref:RNA helicase n=1 Tax=Gracilariopsis chorda TaxID=448386 RepID=A0A2V3IV84_9FLOR|nr:putative ATP-dependent RNA helicase DHX35 [Gracilariopsis chorda]|eukprot:PXF46031.1 putative ATP-dependent RNA helicase DHX35 [Gracilariopsis chorda]
MKRKRTSEPVVVKRDTSLPILQKSNEILSALAANDVLILVSDTGSGKTTQLPQIILDNAPNSSILITQPRRVAAITVATRVAAERGATLGDTVGYAVRFENKSSRTSTRIRYVTDGVLLRETLTDGFSALKRRYSHLIIDEVHERSVNTDIVLGVVKEALEPSGSPATKQNAPTGLGALLRSKLEFKVVLMSATTDAEKIAQFFRNGTSLNVKQLGISGIMHKVNTMFATEPVADYVDGAVEAALQVHTGYSNSGHILVFLPGQEDIMSAIGLLKGKLRHRFSKEQRRSVIILPLFAAQSPVEQLRAISDLPESMRATHRKIIFSTNIAETSVTIPGITYVVDSGVAKVRTLVPQNGLYTDVLRVQPISQAQAEQRKGRAGRTGPGYLFRLYTQDHFNKLEKYPIPEILRIDATSTQLQIIALKHFGRRRPEQNHLRFSMLNKIPRHARERALETLYALGALDKNMKLTETGELMARIPASPMLARSLLESLRLGCIDSMLSTAAVLSVEGSIFLRPSNKLEQAKAAHRRFLSPCGDHLTLVNVLHAYLQRAPTRKTEFCKDHFLNHRTLSVAEDVRNQLSVVMQHGDMVSWGLTHPFPPAVMEELEESGMEDLVRRCLVSGFFRNIARRRNEDGKYVPIGNVKAVGSFEQGVDVHPSSSFRAFRQRKIPSLVIYDELVWTTKMYIRTVCSIEHAWVPLHSSNYFKVRNFGVDETAPSAALNSRPG